MNPRPHASQQMLTGLTHPTGIRPLIGVISTRRLRPNHTAMENLYMYFPHHLEHCQCDDNEPSSSNGSSSPASTTYESTDKGPHVTVDAVATPPHTTSPALDYGEWPLLSNSELRTIQRIVAGDPVPAHIPLPRTVPVGTVQALFNNDLELIDWVVERQQNMHVRKRCYSCR